MQFTSWWPTIPMAILWLVLIVSGLGIAVVVNKNVRDNHLKAENIVLWPALLLLAVGAPMVLFLGSYPERVVELSLSTSSWSGVHFAVPNNDTIAGRDCKVVLINLVPTNQCTD